MCKSSNFKILLQFCCLYLNSCWFNSLNSGKKIVYKYVCVGVVCTCSVMFNCLWPHGSYVHGIFQARILECVAIAYSRESSGPRDWTYVFWVSCIGRCIPYYCANCEAIYMCIYVFIQTSYMQMIPLQWQKLNSRTSWWGWKRRVKKLG